ncbi:MAG: hypothetical protein LBI14_06515 [Treponema sp.]|nr:hypothetical protein [Treponema sp.]
MGGVHVRPEREPGNEDDAVGDLGNEEAVPLAVGDTDQRAHAMRRLNLKKLMAVLGGQAARLFARL